MLESCGVVVLLYTQQCSQHYHDARCPLFDDALRQTEDSASVEVHVVLLAVERAAFNGVRIPILNIVQHNVSLHHRCTGYWAASNCCTQRLNGLLQSPFARQI